MTTTPSGWDDILDPGEEILWQGQPDTLVVWSDLIDVQTAFGVIFTAFSLFWTAGASGLLFASSTASNAPPFAFQLFFPMFGIPFILVGLYMLFGRILWDAHVRGKTWYTLTTKTAYIATDVWGRRRLRAFDYANMRPPEIEDTTPGTVWFASEERRGSKGRLYSVPIGFRRIADARKVWRLINDHRPPS